MARRPLGQRLRAAQLARDELGRLRQRHRLLDVDPDLLGDDLAQPRHHLRAHERGMAREELRRLGRSARVASFSKRRSSRLRLPDGDALTGSLLARECGAARIAWPIMRAWRGCSRSADLTVHYDGGRRARRRPARREPGGRGRRGRRPPRRVGLRQVDAPPRHPRPASAVGARRARVHPLPRPRAALASATPSCGACAGRRSRIVFQDPALALNPVRRVGPQVAEVVAAHRARSARRCRERRAGHAGGGRAAGAGRALRRLPPRAQRRAAAARRHRAGPRLPSGAAPRRRADGLARLHHPGRAARAAPRRCRRASAWPC